MLKEPIINILKIVFEGQEMFFAYTDPPSTEDMLTGLRLALAERLADLGCGTGCAADLPEIDWLRRLIEEVEHFLEFDYSNISVGVINLNIIDNTKVKYND